MVKNIRDIAREAGVSVATVSKVMNNYPHVSQKTRDKVMRVIKDSNFMPNSVARTLVRKRSMTLGLLLATGLRHPFFHAMLVGMEEALKKSGYDLIYLAQISWDKSYSVVQHCRSRNVEGVLAFGFPHDALNWDDLIEANIPAMFVDLDIKGGRAGYITSDNAGAIHEAVDHLVGLGHRRIAILAGLPSSHVGRVRRAAFLDAMAAHGLEVPAPWVVNSTFKSEGGFAAASELLARPERPTAIICASDLEAGGVIEAAQAAGLKVPEDLSVIGFDDIDMAAHCNPPLTTIRQDVERIGREALELLVELVQNPKMPPPERIIPAKLIVRQSTGQAPDAG